MSVARPSRVVLIAALCLAAVACSRSRDEKPQGQLTTAQAPGENPAAPVLVPGLTCNTDGFLTETANPGVAKVTSTQVHFITDQGDGCPSDGPACQAKAYVMKGDTVMTGVANGPYVCAFLPGKGGGSAGWVKPADITEAAVTATPPLEAWVGAWRLGGAVINLKVNDNALVAEGSAPVPGATTAAAAPKPATPPDATAAPDATATAAAAPPPSGKMSGVAQPVGDAVEFAAADPSGCRVDLRLIGPFLAAKDNGQCGGGARFAGVFRKLAGVSTGGGSAKSGTSKSNPNKNVFY